VGDLRRLVAFDLDGTLVDSRRDLAQSANQLIVALGGEALPEASIGRMVGEGAGVLIARAFAAAQVTAPPDALVRFLEIYDQRLLNHTTIYDGMCEVVGRARERARVAVLTNKPRRHAERLLSALGIRDMFDAVVAGDGPYPRKPDPAGLLALMAESGVQPGGTLLVGDSTIDHETARRASARCCLAAYGFGYEMFPPERLDGDEWIAADPGELLAIVDRFTATAD
jgi:phosphoglycolate phosphatase